MGTDTVTTPRAHVVQSLEKKSRGRAAEEEPWVYYKLEFSSKKRQEKDVNPAGGF